MKVLVIGSGGREHALAWKIRQSPHCTELFCAPGNPGTMELGINVPFPAEDIPGLLDFAVEKKIDLTVVGPEVPLTEGIVDAFEAEGLKIFGPHKNAAILEGSKVFAKEFMARHQIPTGAFMVADTADQAGEILETGRFTFPLVVKADGLAAGKGAIICKNREEADEAVRKIMVEKRFGAAGDRLVIEEFLRGKEASFICISDGLHAVPLVTTMDHKAVRDNDEGPNTGGMGAISPSPFMDQALFETVMETLVTPTLTRMLEEGRKLKGVLYVGLMLTEQGPKVLEYNCRFGDPETQPQMLRLRSDILELFLAAIEEDILRRKIEWSSRASGCVILASGGYPGSYKKGLPIRGLKEAAKIPGITIFQAGTEFKDGRYFTKGGRVLGVCASEETLTETMENIYKAIPKIEFRGKHCRQDIGALREEEI
jgi:phosphoribosylamine--glycine ligase